MYRKRALKLVIYNQFKRVFKKNMATVVSDIIITVIVQYITSLIILTQSRVILKDFFIFKYTYVYMYMTFKN